MNPSCYLTAAGFLVGAFVLGWVAGTLPSVYVPKSKRLNHRGMKWATG